MIKAWVMLLCHAAMVTNPCETATLADNETFASKQQCEKQITEKLATATAKRTHCEEITVTETTKYPPAGTRCVILDSPTAGGVYDDQGNCIVPFKFTRPDGISAIRVDPPAGSDSAEIAAACQVWSSRFFDSEKVEALNNCLKNPVETLGQLFPDIVRKPK